MLRLFKPSIYPITAAAPHRVSIVARPHGHDWLWDELLALSREGINTLVSMLTAGEASELGLDQEEVECGAAGIEFVRVPMPDRAVPPDKETFLRTVEHLAELVRAGQHIAVHCRAGIGRSSLLVASILVRLGWKVDRAFDSIGAARGCSVPDTSEQRQWVTAHVPTTRSMPQ